MDDKNKKFPCPYDFCKKSYNLKKRLNEHVKEVHLSKSSSKTCKNCSPPKEFASIKSYNKHITTQHSKRKTRQKISCPKCKKEILEDVLPIHISKYCRQTPSPVSCSNCHKTFKTQGALTNHKKKCLKNSEPKLFSPPLRSTSSSPIVDDIITNNKISNKTIYQLASTSQVSNQIDNSDFLEIPPSKTITFSPKTPTSPEQKTQTNEITSSNNPVFLLCETCNKKFLIYEFFHPSHKITCKILKPSLQPKVQEPVTPSKSPSSPIMLYPPSTVTSEPPLKKTKIITRIKYTYRCERTIVYLNKNK